MAKKRRRHGNGNKNQRPDLERFDERDLVGLAGPDADERSGGGGAGASSGGGLSRAARKRAKKRARAAAAATAAPATTSPEAAGGTVGNGAGPHGAGSEGGGAPSDDEGEHDGGGAEDLQGAVRKFRKEEKKKKKKKPKNDANDNAARAPPAAAAHADAKNEGEAMDAAEAEWSIEMEPELEALLSTLTPLQILLLDDGDGDGDGRGDQKPPSLERPTEETGEIDSPAGNDDDGDDDSDENGGNDAADEAAMLAGIDPLQLVGDLTTEHRARILLLSLIAPSGVRLHQFYERYWGKRPLLACLEGAGDDDEDVGITRKHGKADGEKDDDEAAAVRHATRLHGFLDRSKIEDMIRENKLRYGLDLNVTRYTDATGSGVRGRITLDPPPKKRKRAKGTNGGADSREDDMEYVVANPKDVWSNVDGSRCSVRLLRPHEHDDRVHALLSLLESELGCMVGSNAYLTPRGAQGFAPHYDDVDVFVLQLEGHKRWRVYAPLNKREMLPRESSRDYGEGEVEEGGEGPLMDVVLGPGDVLYLPRGWIHQAETVGRPSDSPALPGRKGDHSLHLTVSAMQNWCWADFLEVLMPEALESAASSDRNISLREGLPRNFLSYMGTMHQLSVDEGGDDAPEGLKQAVEAQARAAQEEGEPLDEEAAMEAQARQRTMAQQKHFKDEAKKRIMRVCKQAMTMLDDACDQVGKRFLSDRLPPALLAPEQSLARASPSSPGHHHHDAARRVWPNTLCRLVRPGVARLVVEDGKAVLYHCLDNSRVYRGTPLSPMEFEVDDAPALEQLLTTVEPRWIAVRDLIHGDVEDKMGIAQALFDEGLLATILTESPDRSVQTG